MSSFVLSLMCLLLLCQHINCTSDRCRVTINGIIEMKQCAHKTYFCLVRKENNDLAYGCLDPVKGPLSCGLSGLSDQSKNCLTIVRENRVKWRDCCCKEGPKCEWAPLKCYDSELKAAKSCEWNQFCVTYRPLATNPEEKAFSGCVENSDYKFSYIGPDNQGKETPFVRVTEDNKGTYYACSTDNCNMKLPKHLHYKAENGISASCVKNGCNRQKFEEQGDGVKCSVTSNIRLECCCSTDLCNVEPHKLLKGETLKDYTEAHGIKTEGTGGKGTGQVQASSATNDDPRAEPEEKAQVTKPPGGAAAWDKAAQTSLVTAILILFVIRSITDTLCIKL